MGIDTPTPGAWPSHMTNDTTPSLPLDYKHSRQSSISSEFSRTSASSAQHASQFLTAPNEPSTARFVESFRPKPELSVSIDPLAREYPEPTEELDVREALSRKPGRWTLGHYIKETPVRSPKEAHELDPEKVARDMEAKKQELLRAKDELRSLLLPKEARPVS